MNFSKSRCLFEQGDTRDGNRGAFTLLTINVYNHLFMWGSVYGILVNWKLNGYDSNFSSDFRTCSLCIVVKW